MKSNVVNRIQYVMLSDRKIHIEKAAVIKVSYKQIHNFNEIKASGTPLLILETG